jgi:pimeloyl-ACP methyl ester carboxylesterase
MTKPSADGTTMNSSLLPASDGVRLYVEDTCSGAPIVFVHEFGGDQRSWEAQVRFFSRRYRCITFNARGYPPSDVPEDVAAYSQRRAVDDIRDVLDGLGIDRAHVVGLSMGGFAALHFGLTYPRRAASLVVAGVGYGAEKAFEAHFQDVAREVARQFLAQGAEAYSHIYACAASRISYLLKDPRGWQEFRTQLGQHSALGSANTMLGIQAQRPSLFDMEAELASMSVPTLIVSGDEDDHCLQPALFLKRSISASGMLILPKTGHTLNLEEPGLFNEFVADFISCVTEERWPPRDARARTSEILKVK